MADLLLRGTDSAYYTERAAKAEQAAARAGNPQVRAIHLQMAERYRGLASAAAPGLSDEVQQAVDCISEALTLLDAAGRTAEAAYLSTALEMLVVLPDEA